VAGGTIGARGGRQAIVGINVTPMVDVVLVLLVIMMVSANYIVSQSLNVDLPKAANGDAGAASLAVVTIAPDGGLKWNDGVVTEAELKTALKAAQAENPEVNLVVSADARAAHGAVVHVMDLAKAEGITHFAIGVEQPE
jgi:biopolymer transport protein ExbD